MKKVIFLFFLVLLACNFDKKCNKSLTLNSDIYIYGWDKNYFIAKKAIIYEYDKTDKENEINSYLLKNIVLPDTLKNRKELYLRTSGIFKTKNNYKLIINDSLEFKISDFKISNIDRGTAITVQKYCVVKNYRVNNTLIKQNNNHLQFDKSLGRIIK
ncbi:hypothetical protein C7448_10683 [Tenacibaculum gallaicum]|uniref:Uncharacterized protein n=1 Tax=Tenacibaculum gallaicum TaxID=561505 RepID=A0A3E0HLT5_9FLAO|nr:hypothetical protein [Tenacibaculum gallaicum]REH47462.1 hypothetical protein C7448_10683 [Tenacibaculum gallaicum]